MGRRTVDVCSRREGGIMGECLGDVVVCPVHVGVFLSSAY